MTCFSHVVVLDFEATCDAGPRLQPQEIIEFPSVLLSLQTLQVVDEFERFVRPIHHPQLTEFCRSLTAIQQQDVDAAAMFADVFAQHQAWLAMHGLSERNAVIATCGDWDLGTMLPAQCRAAQPPIASVAPIYQRWHNLKRSFCAVTGRQKPLGMSGMLRVLQLELSGHHHRGIDDCRNLAVLCRELVNRGANIGITKERASQ
ncbi:MAG: 3'-5' exonuclease [Planctomycetota bacterium]